MSANTKIQWTDRTWNPVRGCSRVSEGCRNCYAERMAGRFAKPGSHRTDECVGIYETSEPGWQRAQASAIRQAKADAAALAAHASRNLAPRAAP